MACSLLQLTPEREKPVYNGSRIHIQYNLRYFVLFIAERLCS